MTTMPLAMTKFTCEAGATSPLSSSTRPGLGMRMTSSLRPEASVAASSMRAISFSTLALGSSAPAGDWQTTRPGPTKRASVSIWPSVWSFRRPWSIQMIFLAPKASRSAASAWASVQPLRLSLSRVCRVARMRAVAVLLDGAALEDEIEFADRRAGKLGDVVADGGVLGQIELAAPTVGHESARPPGRVRRGQRSGRCRAARCRRNAPARSPPRCQVRREPSLRPHRPQPGVAPGSKG